MSTEPDDLSKLCQQCGHDFNAHLLKGHGSPPKERWVECPVEDCDCAMTWSLGPKSKLGGTEK